MSDLDAVLAATTPEIVTAVSIVPGKHSHTWELCACGAQRDMLAPRKGKSADRLGKDQERRIEKTYGPRKVGEHGDAVDLIGRDYVWQAKATRSDPPSWLAAVDQPTIHPAPAIVLTSVAAMEPLRRNRQLLVIQAFVSRRGTVDRIWVRSLEWAEMHGGPRPMPTEWTVMSGEAFLAIHGRDEG